MAHSTTVMSQDEKVVGGDSTYDEGTDSVNDANENQETHSAVLPFEVREWMD